MNLVPVERAQHLVANHFVCSPARGATLCQVHDPVHHR